MINFEKKYNQEDFLAFVSDFLPTDFLKKEKDIIIDTQRYKEMRQAKVLGWCKSLDLYVLEMEHDKEKDPRITIATDAFKILADHWIHQALVIFTSKNSDNYRLSYLTISLDLNEKSKVVKKYSNARRYSFFLGPNAKVNTPTRFLINQGKVLDLADLKRRFSLEVVNKEFYKEIAECFTKLVGGTRNKVTYEAQLKLPSNTGRSQTSVEFAVRLIGRVIFAWFLREKTSDSGLPLMTKELLSIEAVNNNEGYYHRILEPIFFEVLNRKVRREEYEGEPFASIPYLNGGLFSPHDDDFYRRNRGELQSQYFHTLVIPDSWIIDFFTILEQYNFTIDENTSFDEELSIDPEMLGRIFENLLAEINPETGESARKSTGSYYTPRIIVDYMVDESLLLYLRQKTRIDEAKLRAVISYDLMDDLDHPLDSDEKGKIIDALETIKILDPACGSGAFPIGALQKIVFILQQVDPNGELWVSKQLAKASPEFKRDIQKRFSSGERDFLRKLGVIRECIFGVDIQPIATEISRLRCFLTLIVDEHITDTEDNRGIKPLPNLDFKFVTANSLISPPEEENTTQDSFLLKDFQCAFEIAVADYFMADDADMKQRTLNTLHELIDKKVGENFNAVRKDSGFIRGERFQKAYGDKQREMHETLLQEADIWQSYKNIFKNKPVDFFDPKYFFPSVKEGFDIVIANPPYVQIQKFARTQMQENLKSQKFKTFTKNADIYCLFYERGIQLLKDGGLLTFITSNKWMRAGYGEKLRAYFVQQTNPLRLLDFGGFKVFESATVDTNILITEKQTNSHGLLAVHFNDDYKKGEDLGKYVAKNAIVLREPSNSGWFIGSSLELDLKKKIESIGKPLKDWDVKIYRGVLTGLNEAFIIDTATKDRLCQEDPKSAEIIKPILRGRDIQRYGYEWAGLWLILVKYGFADELEKYPAILKHLKSYEANLRERGQCNTSRSGKEISGKRGEIGQHHWLELDNNPSNEYLMQFEKEKVVWAETMRIHKTHGAVFPRFSIASPMMYMDKTCFFFTSKQSRYLVGILNSRIGRYLVQTYVDKLDTGGYMMQKAYIECFPIPETTNGDCFIEIESLVTQILAIKKSDSKANTKEFEDQIDQMVYELYGLTEEEIGIVEGGES